jgi:hypothetical protein
MSDIVKVPMESFQDFLGNTVKVGDHVVYATISDRSPVQKYAEVVAIVSKQVSRDRYFRDTGDAEGTTPGGHWGTETVSEIKVGVRELSNGRGFTRWDTRVYDKNWRRVEGESKPARVTYPMKENIVLARTAKEIELAEREAELRAHPVRITFGEKAYDA